MTASGISGLQSSGLAQIRAQLRDPILRKEITYEATAERLSTKECRLSKGALWKFLNTSYIPGIPIEEIKSSNRIRRALGLPEMIVSFRYRDELGQFRGGKVDAA